MADVIVNGAPLVVDYGPQDLSTKQVPRQEEMTSQHLPKFFVWSQKGPTTPQLVTGTEVSAIYGSETLNEAGEYATHATPFINMLAGKGNPMMLTRLVPTDAPPPASLIAWLDVLPTTVDLYQRNDDGSYALDSKGDLIVTGTASGYKVKWVVTNDATAQQAAMFGKRVVARGSQTDGNGVQSQRWPVFETRASSQGKPGNRSGLRLWAPTTASVSAMPSKMMATHKAYPFYMQVINKPSDLGAVGTVGTMLGDQKLMVTFKEKAEDPVTGLKLYAGDTFIDAYQNVSDPRYATQYGDFGAFHAYAKNIETLVKMFQAAEAPFIDETSDFTADEADAHLFNFVTGVSSSNIPYHSYVFVDESDSVRWSDYTNVFAAGGGDGTMTNEVYDAMVADYMNKYLDPSDPVQDRAVAIESMFYDTGFSLPTKFSLYNALAYRRDVAVTQSTFIYGEEPLTEAQEQSVASALLTRARNFPESDYFGTPVGRVTIVGRSGRVRGSQWKGRVPVTYELAAMRADYMGGSSGAWKSGRNYDGAPGSVLRYMYDINITWVPGSTRNRYWDVGLNYPLSFNRNEYFFPCVRTVYQDDTSVLNSDITMLLICYLNKLAHKVWREFSGVSGLSDAVLCKRVNDYAAKLVDKKFDGRYKVIPDARISDMDALRGNTWQMAWKVGAPNMKTVMTTYTQVYRINELGKVS